MKSRLCNTGVQTYNCILTDEAPQYAAVPPPCSKKELIPSSSIFTNIDKHALRVPDKVLTSIKDLTWYLCSKAYSDLQRVRVIFRWITNNIVYDSSYLEKHMRADEMFEKKEGVCKDFCILFGEMCNVAGIRVKTVNGFAKCYEYRPGYIFAPNADVTHSWNAIFIGGSWRLIDCTWGTGYIDQSGVFQKKLNEHFFLTDPEVLIWSHFPYDEMEKDYSRWQLLNPPKTLEEFNKLPKVSPYFFDYHIYLRSRIQNPVTIRFQRELLFGSKKPIWYKYKLYPEEEQENAKLNSYVLFQLKERRKVGSFLVVPPKEGRYLFKLYGRPETDMKSGEETLLHNLITVLIHCVNSKKNPLPFPLNDTAWGPNHTFKEFKMQLLNRNGHIKETNDFSSRLVLKTSEKMLLTYHLYDINGKEMNDAISKKEEEDKIILEVLPKHSGMFKLMLFGMPKPKTSGEFQLPLIGCFLVKAGAANKTEEGNYVRSEYTFPNLKSEAANTPKQQEGTYRKKRK